MALFHLAGCASTDGGFDEPLGTEEEAVSYDTTPKPIPSTYLTQKTINNRCCVGQNQRYSASCALCADATTGLVTSAGYDKADDYYRATGQWSLDTLEKWKANFGFPKRVPGQNDLYTFRRDNNVVIYYNRTELGLGRELGCAESNGNIACYVTNYGDTFDSVHNLWQPDAANPDGLTSGLSDAIVGNHPKNTVVISSVPSRNGNLDFGTSVQFAAYDAAGKRLKKAQLDTMGARPIPQICMSCHGGVWDANGTTTGGNSYYGIARFARFLPLVTSTVSFSNTPLYTLADQELAIKKVNEYAVRTSEGLTSRQKDLMGWLYAVNWTTRTLAFQSSSPGRQFAENAWPGGWEGLETAYNVAALPYCDTCHMAMNPSSSWGVPQDPQRPAQEGMMYALLAYPAEMQRNRLVVAAYMGVTPSGFSTDKAAFQMPHAQNMIARFWGDTTGLGGTCSTSGVPGTPAMLTGAPMGVCFLGTSSLALWSGWPDGAKFTAAHPYPQLVPAATVQGQEDCGQARVTSSTNTTGVNSGRRVGSAAIPGTNPVVYVNQCGNGCKANEVYCPGSETANNPSSTRFPNARLECRPISSSYGNCVACGRINQPACQQVGSGCRTDMNPNCTNLTACHEGTNASGLCIDGLLTGGTASQSSTRTTHVASRARDGNYDPVRANMHVSCTNSQANAWWQLSYSTDKHITYIEIYDSADSWLDNFEVQYQEAGVWKTFEGGSFGTGSGYIFIEPPVPVVARNIRVWRRDTNFLEITELNVGGW